MILYEGIPTFKALFTSPILTQSAPAPRFAKCFITLKFEFALTAYAIKDFLALKALF
jgi:hypothetical protein